MISNTAINDYNQFMQWFQQQYPVLHKQHCDTIIMALSGEGVTVDRDHMDPATYKTVIAITQEYFRNEFR